MSIKVEPRKQIHSHQALLTESRTESLKKNIKQLGGCATNKSMKLHTLNIVDIRHVRTFIYKKNATTASNKIHIETFFVLTIKTKQ